jgi:AcrR family transcriptional regulator
VPVSCPPALRADAERNRLAVVAAARAVFGERGLDAPLDEIARRAGVGNATLYRRFPSRHQLVAAVFAQTLRDVLATMERSLADPDPWKGFCDYVWYVCGLQAADRGLADLLTMSMPIAASSGWSRAPRPPRRCGRTTPPRTSCCY